jgi:hypothetical protein
VAYTYQLGASYKSLIVGIQSADSGNRFATYVSVQGTGLSLLFKQIGSSVPKSPLSANSGMAILIPNHGSVFQREIRKKISAMTVNGLSALNSLQQESLGYV